MKTEITTNLVNFYANSIDSIGVVENLSAFMEITASQDEEIASIIAESQIGWDELECDEDGATKEQSTKMDAYLEKISNEILDVL